MVGADVAPSDLGPKEQNSLDECLEWESLGEITWAGGLEAEKNFVDRSVTKFPALEALWSAQCDGEAMQGWSMPSGR